MTDTSINSATCMTRYLARVVIELETAAHVGAGREWNGADAGLVLDANGLPAIPGSSIAGVLRHAIQATDPHLADSLFGHQKPAHKARSGRGAGQGSRLSVSWAAIHSSHDTPVPALGADETDPVLQAARNPALRDHVRINRRGAALDGHKFDQLVIQAGHRFTFELELAGREADTDAWQNLLGLLHDPFVRFGGKVHRGLGRFKVVRVSSRRSNLLEQKDWEDYLTVSPELGNPLPGTKFQAIEAKTNGEACALHLQPQFFWMFGGGRDDTADMAPVRETVITWHGAQAPGAATERFYVPGSSVKGALRHRTLFHACALVGCFADKPDWRDKLKAAEALVQEIFGEQIPEEENDRGRDTPCAAGRIFIDDIALPTDPNTLMPARKPGFLDEPHLQHHVSIDRFTGGARDSLLFSEKPLFHGEPIELRYAIRGDVSPDARKAFNMALDDLGQGRLALGAGAGRGLGRFKLAGKKEASHAS